MRPLDWTAAIKNWGRSDYSIDVEDNYANDEFVWFDLDQGDRINELFIQYEKQLNTGERHE